MSPPLLFLALNAPARSPARRAIPLRVARICSSFVLGAIISGNGANAILDSTFTHSHRTGIEAYGYALRIEGCTFEPDSDISSPTYLRAVGIRAYGYLGPLTLVLTNNIFNDANAASTGKGWLEAYGVAVINEVGNYWGDDSPTRAAMYLSDGCQTVHSCGFFFCARVVEFGPGTVNGGQGFLFFQPWYQGATPIIGSNYSTTNFAWYGAVAAWPGSGAHFGNTHTDFATFQYGSRDITTVYTAGNGTTNDIPLTTGCTVVSGPTAAFTLRGFSYGGAGDGQRFRLIYAGAQQMTIAHEAGTTSTYRAILPGGVDIVFPAAGGPWVLDFVRDQSAPVQRWRLVSPVPIPPGLQSGVATLVAGVTTAIAATITANSRIIATVKTPGNTATTTDYAALSGDRVVGAPGSFKLTALLAAGTIDTANTSVLDWMVVG